MNRLIFSIFLLLSAISSWGQAQLTSRVQTQNLGQIEWKVPVSIRYAITNTGDEPLVLTNVSTSCGCTTASWTRTPIAPGEEGFVNVEFDAALLGHFDKSVGIYSNSNPELVYLNFIGEVVKEISDFSKSHPYRIGDILLDKNEIEFMDVQKNEKYETVLSVVNLTNRPYRPILMHLPPYIQADMNPKVIQKGKKGEVKLTVNPDKLIDYGLIQSSFYLARFTGDKVSSENEIPLTIVSLPPLPDKSTAQSPRVKLSTTELQVSEELAKRSKVSRKVFIKNEGKENLEILKVQVFNPAVSLKLNRTILGAGDEARLKVTISSKLLSKYRNPLRILVITNDPNNSKIIIDLK